MAAQSRRWWILVLGVGLAVGLLEGSASAETKDSLDGYKVTHSTRVYDAVVSYPAPSWYQGKDPLNMSENYRNQQGPHFVLEQIPKGESFERWTRMYAVSGTYVGKGRTVPIDAFIDATVAGYVQMCGRENLAYSPLAQDQNSRTLLLYCQESSMGQAGIGYGPGIGEIALIRFFVVKNTLLKVYQEWRGKAFLARDESSWPVARSEVTMMVERFKEIQVGEYQF